MSDDADGLSPQHLRDRPIGQLVSAATEQISRLVRDEMRLATIELKQKGKRLGFGAGLLGGAGVLAFYGGEALVAAAILALATQLPPWLAALIVGAVVLAVASVFALVGKKQVQRAGPLVPEETAVSVKSDIKTIKEGIHR
ncbi:MAG: phage holin family protein [Pseudonocardiaceae bacterium]